MRSLLRKVRRHACTTAEALCGAGVRPTDIFLCGHPKSGMTWMKFLLAHALLEKRAGEHLTLKNQNRYVPDLPKTFPHEPLRIWRYAHRPAPRVFFTHALFDPRFTRGRVIYMLRDPRDVLVSHYHHHRRRTAAFNLTLSEFIRTRAHKLFLWDEHVESWLRPGHDQRAIHVCRYEQLRAAPHEHFAQVLAFTGAAHTPADIDRAVAQSDFKRMRAIEQKYPAHYTKYDPAEFQVRKGQVGGWRAEMTPADAAYVAQRFGPTMRRLGYDPGVPAEMATPSATAPCATAP